MTLIRNHSSEYIFIYADVQVKITKLSDFKIEDKSDMADILDFLR